MNLIICEYVKRVVIRISRIKIDDILHIGSFVNSFNRRNWLNKKTYIKENMMDLIQIIKQMVSTFVWI